MRKSHDESSSQTAFPQAEDGNIHNQIEGAHADNTHTNHHYRNTHDSELMQ